MTEEIMTDRERTALQLSRAHEALEKVWPTIEEGGCMTETTELKHTPGPWEASHNGVHRRISKGYAQCVAIAHDPNEPGQVTDVTLANARLMAAAPELLDALQDAMRWFAKLEDWRGVGDPDIDKYRAAIEKATGEKP